LGLIVLVLLGALAILGAVCAKVFADEFKAWAPTIVAKIIDAAVRTLPAELRERFSEEWLSHVNQIPGDLTKIAVACGFVIAASDMANGPFRLRKRVLDLVFAGVTLLALAPLLLFVALVIKLDSPGPILARHTRIGRHGKPFQILKFRTTRVDGAPQRVELTAIGGWLRRTSIEELPKLLNVLSGDMSMVGPRPLAEEDDLEQANVIDLYKACRPGLTGLWAFGAKDIASYASNWSLKLDMIILLATVGAVLKKRNDADDLEAGWKIILLATIFSIVVFFGMTKMLGWPL
jgi:exopolysaccharide production protein ExoY